MELQNPTKIDQLNADRALTGPDAIFFYERSAEWALPIEALVFVTQLAQHPKFKVQLAHSWDPRLDGPKVSSVLRQLIQAGVLTYSGQST